MLKKCAIFLFLMIQLQSSVFDWFTPTVTSRAKRAQTLMEDFDSAVEQALRDYQVPGLAIALVVDHHVVYAKGFGYRDLENKLPATADTLFAIGSCTKAFTSFLLGTLVDEGRLSWDDSVIDVLPEFRLWDQYATQNLTLRDLLTHRTGMPRHDFMWYNSSMTRAEVMRRIRFLEPSCDIRERYQYNNLMYLTAGYAMEQVTGKSWEELISDRILKPLGMKQTNFSVQEMQKASDYAFPYLEKEDKLKKMPFRNISVIGPAGGINSSVRDLACWVQMQLSGGWFEKKSLISPATLQEMHAPQVVISGAPETKETLLTAYGIGWTISSYRGQYYVSHDGGIDGFTSIVGLLPHSGVGIIVLCNKNLTTLPRYLSFLAIDRVLELPYIDWIREGLEGLKKSKESMQEKKLSEDLHRKKGTHPSHPLEDFVGDYFHPGYGKVSIELHDGNLCSVFNGISSTLNHWHYDVFTIADESQDLLVSREGTKLTFQNDVNGEIDRLAIPFEPISNDIIFKKVALESLTTTTYLRHFTGFYEIYGYTVEVAVRNGALCALIPGQPLYELIPVAENEFSVKSLAGYSVRFNLDETGNVEEVLLIQPYGALTATPRKYT